MRIFHVITLSSLGGAQSVVINLANRQVLENEVFVISGVGGNAWGILNPNVKVLRIPELKRQVSFLDVVVFFKLAHLYSKYKPDVIHLHSSKIGVLGRLVFPKTKTVYTVHGFDSVRLANPKFLFIEKLLKNRVSHIVGVSEYDEKNLHSEGIVNNVSFIYNGIEDKSAIGVDSVGEFETRFAELHLHYSKVIFCIARDNEQKKIHLFFDIAQELSDNAFVWIGNENGYTDIPENVFLMGLVSNASSYLKYADLFILPSNYEGLPVSIIEALSFGKPVVASNVGGISELLNGDNGFVVENCVNDFAEKILYILGDVERAKIMQNEARNTYLEQFTVDKMANSYLKIYEKVQNSVFLK